MTLALPPWSNWHKVFAASPSRQLQIAPEDGFGIHDASCRCPACLQAATAPQQASLPLPTSDRPTPSPRPASEALANAMRRES